MFVNHSKASFYYYFRGWWWAILIYLWGEVITHCSFIVLPCSNRHEYFLPVTTCQHSIDKKTMLSYNERLYSKLSIKSIVVVVEVLFSTCHINMCLLMTHVLPILCVCDTICVQARFTCFTKMIWIVVYVSMYYSTIVPPLFFEGGCWEVTKLDEGRGLSFFAY